MARYLVAAAGAAIGFLIAGPAGLAMGWSIGSLIGTLLFPPKGPEGPRLEDLKVQISSYGAPVPRAWGWVRLSGNMIWATDLVEEKHETGKGGPSMTEYRYYGNATMAFCEGPFDPIEIRGDGKLIWSRNHLTGEIRSKYESYISWQAGTEEDLPPSLHERYDGVGNVPGYRGVFKIHLDLFPLADFGNRIPSLSVVGFAGETTPVSSTYLLDDAIGSYQRDEINWYQPEEILYTGTPDGTDYNFYEVNALDMTLLREATLVVDPSHFNVSMIGVDAETIYFASNGAFSGKIYMVDRSTLELRATTGDISDLVSLTAYLSVSMDGFICVFYIFGFSIFDSEGALVLSGDYDADSFIRIYPVPTDSSNEFWSAAITGGGTTITIVQWDMEEGPDEDVLVITLADIGEDDFGTTIQTAWDRTANSRGLIVHTENFLFKVSDSKEIMWVVPNEGHADQGLNWSGAHRPHVDGGKYYTIRDDEILVWDTATGTVTDTFTAPDDWDHATSGVGATVGGWMAANSVMFDDGSAGVGITRVFLGNEGQMNLGIIVRDICTDAGMEEDLDFEVTDLYEKPVHGYLCARQISARAMIEPLMAPFFFDAIESEGILRFKFRDKASAATIDPRDLATHNFGDTAPAEMIDVRMQEIELPFKLTMAYHDPQFDYQEATQYAMRHRLSQWSDHETSVQVPISETADNAKQIVEKMLYQAWMARTGYEFQLPQKYVYLDPADVITVPTNDITAFIFITEMEIGADGLLKMKGVSHSQAVYEDSANTGAPHPDPDDEIPILSATIIYAYNVPLLDDSFDDDNGFLVAAEGADPSGAWPGGILYKTPDGSTFTKVVSIPEEGILGRTTTLLPDHSHLFLDRTNTVRVRIGRGTLESLSWDAFKAGGNYCLINGELISFQIATLVSTGLYDLTIMKRGLQGSEWATSEHTATDEFLLLNDAIRGAPMPGSEIGLEKTFRPVTIGMSIADAESEDFEFTATNLHMKPIAPAHLKGERDGSDNLTVTWTPRVRMNPQMHDNFETVIDEVLEQYRVRFYDGATLKRTVVVTTPTASYSAADQTTDFGSPQDPILTTVEQFSTRVGYGYPTEREI